MKQDNAFSLPAKLLRYLLMAFVLMISLYPILWVFLNSFKRTPGGLGLPDEWVFDGYITIFTKLNIGQYFLNSLIVTVISTVISVFVVSLAAYVSARISFKGKNLVTLMFASTLFIPSISISFPIYRLLSDLGLKDTLTGIIFVYSSLGIAVTFFILRSYFLTIPKEMEEAAMMDGCGYIGTYFRIIVPIAKPGLATAAKMGLFTAAQGTYSTRLSDGSFIITPLHADPAYLEADDLVRIQDGAKEPGKTPDADVLLHQKIYDKNPKIGAIAFAQPVHSMVFAVTDMPFDTRMIPESYILLRDVKRIPFEAAYQNLDDVAAEFDNAHPVLLIENKLVIVTGASMLQVFDRLEVMEMTAASILKAQALGTIAHIPSGEIAALKTAFHLED